MGSRRRRHAPTCETFGVPMSILPAIKSCSEVYATMACTKLVGVPISGCAGDQHAAMLGQCCLQSGQARAHAVQTRAAHTRLLWPAHAPPSKRALRAALAQPS
jgi:hypothetical protein